MVKFLVEHGACVLATTLSDHETAAEKCEEDEEGFDGCSEYLYSVQVHFDFEVCHSRDEAQTGTCLEMLTFFSWLTRENPGLFNIV